MLCIVPHTVPRVGRLYEHFPDGFEIHFLPTVRKKGQGVIVELLEFKMKRELNCNFLAMKFTTRSLQYH